MAEPSSQMRRTGKPEDPSASQTDWRMIEQAGQTTEPSSTEAWENLARRYWPAVYAFFRSRGSDVHEASDLTQGFICDVLIKRGLVSKAQPQRGRFRNLLLTALRNYSIEQHRRTQRRTPPHRPAPSGRGGGSSGSAADRTQDPQRVFTAWYTATMVRQVLDGVREQCARQQLSAHWTIFEERVLRPLLSGQPPTSYRVLTERLNVRDAAQAANMMITVKRRVARALHEEVERTTGSNAEADEELFALLRALERPT